MDRLKLQKFELALKNEKERHERTLKMMDQTMNSDGKSAFGELSQYDNHPADVGTELFMIQHQTGLKAHEENILKEIEDARQRIREGSYGICELCGKQINESRLEAIPYARLCIDCENSKPVGLEYLKYERPIEEKVLDAPLGRKYLNQQEDDEHEGLDYLYDLEHYGSSDTPQDRGGYYDYRNFYTNDADFQGVVDPVDKISNELYRRQLPD